MRRVLRFLVLGVWVVGCGATTHPGQIDTEGGVCHCGASQSCCDGKCVNEKTDPRNCGGCGFKCGNGQFCNAGQCSAIMCRRSCPSGLQCCGDSCCGGGQMCCSRPGSLSGNPVCATAVDGTCPQG